MQINGWYQLKLVMFDKDIWKHLIVCWQMNCGSFKNNLTYKLFTYKLCIYIIIIIIIMKSCCEHEFPWLSLSIHPYNPLRLVGSSDNIRCLHKAVMRKYLLVSQHQHIHLKGSIEERHLWVCLYFSNSVLDVLFILFRGF